LDHRFGHHHRYVRDGVEGRFVVRLSRRAPGAPPSSGVERTQPTVGFWPTGEVRQARK
jgi:hypothetical protein